MEVVLTSVSLVACPDMWRYCLLMVLADIQSALREQWEKEGSSTTPQKKWNDLKKTVNDGLVSTDMAVWPAPLVECRLKLRNLSLVTSLPTNVKHPLRDALFVMRHAQNRSCKGNRRVAKLLLRLCVAVYLNLGLFRASFRMFEGALCLRVTVSGVWSYALFTNEGSRNARQTSSSTTPTQFRISCLTSHIHVSMLL